MKTNLENAGFTLGELPWDASGRREFLKMAGTGVAAAGMLSAVGGAAFAADVQPNPGRPAGADNFYRSDKVTVQPVTFKNQYQMTVAGNLFIPRTLDRKKRNPALVVGHPMGAVKEQSANLYATKMAEQGFVAMSLDLAAATAGRAMPLRRTCTPRTSARRWITSAARPSWTGSGSVPSAFAAAAALSSARRRSTRA
jgi:hypothetical protein